MQVIAKKKLYYGIIRNEGTQFELTSPDHFDARVHTPVDDAPAPMKPAKNDTPKKAGAPDTPTDAAAELAAAKAAADAEAQKAEVERLAAENAKAAAEATQAGPQPVARRRSTADTKR